MKELSYILLLMLFSMQLAGQVYVEKQTRHRFAQLTLGLDYQTNFGGNTQYLNRQNQLQVLDFNPQHKARFLIGGTHFWGHADIYLAIPLGSPVLQSDRQEVNFLSGVETVFKYYPLRIQHNRLRPFLGVSLAPFYYEQDNGYLDFGNGPELNHTSLPLITGLTFNTKNHLFEAGLLWNYANKQDYFITQEQEVEVTTPPLYFNLSYRFMLETTLPAEKDWESGRSALVTAKLGEGGGLNDFYVGIGMSSAFWLGNSDYNESERPYISRYSTSIMPDFTAGYYLHKADMNIALSYRSYGTSTNTYGAIQRLKRKSLGLEVTKALFDYHGFVPFVGPIVSYEQIGFKESYERQLTQDVSDNKISYGLTFGWDIRPDRRQIFLLRTNLRWYPDLKLDVGANSSVSFNNIEFNFIQLVLYPDRLF